MILDPVSQTARWTAAARARESSRPDRLFDDPWAARLAASGGFVFLDLTSPDGHNPYIAVRTRWLDDALASAHRQVVLVAAGLDTRAWRLDWPPGTVVVELDRDEVFREKARVLGGVAPRCVRREVAVELDGAWEPALLAAGFDPTAPTTWVVEGLLVYLDESSAPALLGRLAALSAAGSVVQFDLPARSFLAHPLSAPVRARLAELGAPWRYGTSDPEGLATGAGWAHPVVIRPGDPGAHHGRWPHPVAPRGLVPMENYFVRAVRG